MRLYIAEKPSMGREIAKCLQGPARVGSGFIETAEGVVTWCFGHILRQAEPEEYDAAYKKWTESVLPNSRYQQVLRPRISSSVKLPQAPS